MQSQGLFNLDAMQSDDQEEELVETVAAPTAGKNGLQTVATANVEAPTNPKVTKLQMASGDDDDFNFDAWGEDEIDVTDDKDESDETAERMRQESQKLAQQIMEDEQRKEGGRLRAEEEEKKKKQQLQQEVERIKQEKISQEEMERKRWKKMEEENEAKRLEQQRLEQLERERQAAEEVHAAEEERLRKLREEEEVRLRLEEEEKLIEEQKQMELERQAQEEARAAEEERIHRLREEQEEERLRLEAEQEAKRLEEEDARAEKERLLQEEERQRMRLEEEERLLLQKRRLESERQAQEEARAEKERLQLLREEHEREEEAKLLEEMRLESERQAEEEVQFAEEERLRMVEQEEGKLEYDGLKLEKDARLDKEQQHPEQEVAKNVKDGIGDDDDGWSNQSEELEDDDERKSSETADTQATQSPTEAEEHSDIVAGTESSKELAPDDVNYGETPSDVAQLKNHGETPSDAAQLNGELSATHASILPSDAQCSHGDDSSAVNVVQHETTASTAPDDTIFGVATTSSLQSMIENQATNLFTEASKTASIFSWGQSSAEDGIATHALATTNAELDAKEKPVSKDDVDDLYGDDDLDAMYDDDDSDDSEAHDETNNQELQGVKNNDFGEVLDNNIENDKRMPSTSAQHTVEDFVKQLERMSESHQLEMNEMQRSHHLEIERLQNELTLERDKKEKDKARKEVASQDKFLSQMRDLEKKFNTDLKEKDEELQKVMQRNEGMRLKMDSMKREVDGLIKLVDERDDEIAILKQGHGKSMVQAEGKVKYSEEELARKDAEISKLKANMSSLQADLDSTTEAYHTLKERAKSVATELKDRRVEVRTLASQNQELSSSKTLQDTQLTNLRAVVNQHELTISYKDKDMEALNAKVKELQKQIEGKEKSIQDSSAVGEKAIASYKKKAQEALAAANARLALSNQAREEAESEAKAAKSASDDAVKRARDAELKMSEAEQRASAATTLLNDLKLSSSEEIKELKNTIDNLRSTIDSMQVEAEEDANEREKLNVEIGQLRTNLVEVKKKESELREKLIEQQSLCNSLQKEVHDLNDEVQRNAAAAFKRANDEKTHSENLTDRTSSRSSMDANGSAKAGERQEADGTIIMLQQELRGANEAIADLKLALRTALLEKADGECRDKISDGNEAFASDPPRGNDSTPLFYAIEKQNELNTARDEINRLANLLGDAEAEKQEAYDIMEDMRHKMEEANARLLRYEKLGMKGARPQQNVSQSRYGPFRNTSQSSSMAMDNKLLSSGNDSVVNLEYLKNVMLSYLKAKTLADRRKLVPVIATVLCLTPEEQTQAVMSVEESAGLSGVAVSFWENIGESAIHWWHFRLH
ncbi:hypothetical protein ACHAXM_011926 [Skeletonema potamos]